MNWPSADTVLNLFVDCELHFRNLVGDAAIIVNSIVEANGQQTVNSEEMIETVQQLTES